MEKQYYKISMGSDRNFGYVFAAIFLIFSLWPMTSGKGPVHLLLLISIAFLLTSFFKPKIFKPLNKIWFKFGILLGSIIAPIVMMAIFFLIITPIGIMMRLLKKDIIKKNYDPNISTYWVECEKKTGSMKNQF